MKLDSKKQVVDSLNGVFKSNKIVIIAHYSGVSVEQVNILRSSARKNNAGVKVAKNSLIRLAVEGTEFSNLKDQLKGPVILIYSEDIVAAAKVLVDFAKSNESLVIQLASYNESLVGTKEIVDISKMPSLDEIRAKLISLIKTPATKIATIVQAPSTQVVRVVDAYSQN